MPFHLCLRLGVAHPDYLDAMLTAGQWDDWLQFDRQFNVALGRDDVHWARLIAELICRNLCENESPPTDIRECSPYLRHDLELEDMADQEEFLSRLRTLGGGRVFREAKPEGGS